MSAAAIAVLWKDANGTSCVVGRRGTTLVLRLEHNGAVQRELVIESPREAMDMAAKWKATQKDS